ncbi:hypothetical protein BD779DRAFT_1474796 [Infundibulicybe gibba]|nr:hypothetical protein BD779DRAFT_1474796 [Infundibulicybe gibba]
MKFASTSVLFGLISATLVAAQNVAIGFPADGAAVTAGTNVTVEIDRPNSLSGSTEVAVVIGLQSCPTTDCASPSSILGTILYNGPYSPAFQPGAPGFKPPHQNFTVLIPSTAQKGRARLGVAHMSLIGAGLAPFMETLNVSLTIN